MVLLLCRCNDLIVGSTAENCAKIDTFCPIALNKLNNVNNIQQRSCFCGDAPLWQLASDSLILDIIGPHMYKVSTHLVTQKLQTIYTDATWKLTELCFTHNSHWASIHCHPLPASHSHYLTRIVLLNAICFLRHCSAWVSIALIESHSVFVFCFFYPFIGPPPSPPLLSLLPPLIFHPHTVTSSRSK